MRRGIPPHPLTVLGSREQQPATRSGYNHAFAADTLRLLLTGELSRKVLQGAAVTEATVGDVDKRATNFARGTDLTWVAVLLAERRAEILERWLDVAATQAFHAGERDHAVADDIPRLFDALVARLRADASPWLDPAPPLEDPKVVETARAHAEARFRQGLEAADIVTEFRLLRQEIGRALRLHATEQVSTADILGAALVVNDALDGAVSLGLEALTRHVEETREDFLATTLHDVRQPLSSIKGGIQLAARMLSGPQVDAERVASTLARAEIETNRMIVILEMLTDASRLALGRLEPQVEEVDFVALLRDIIGRLDSTSAQRVRLQLSADLDPRGHWDPTMLDRVVTNLVSNGLKYSPATSPLTISCENESDALHISIRDEGIGLTADEIPRLFRRYGRAGGAVASGVDGLGLGLYLSKGIVEAHGGRILAESDGPGQGSTMHVVLPRDIGLVPASAVE